MIYVARILVIIHDGYSWFIRFKTISLIDKRKTSVMLQLFRGHVVGCIIIIRMYPVSLYLVSVLCYKFKFILLQLPTLDIEPILFVAQLHSLSLCLHYFIH